MRIDPNDHRITAYILNELDAEERARFEEEMAGCAESRAHIEEMRAATELLSQELRRETAPELAPHQRERIEQRLERSGAVRGLSRWLFDWRVGVLVPATACILLVLANQAYYTGRVRQAESAREMVENAARNRPAVVTGDPVAAPMESEGLDRYATYEEAKVANSVEALSESLARGKEVDDMAMSIRVSPSPTPVGIAGWYYGANDGLETRLGRQVTLFESAPAPVGRSSPVTGFSTLGDLSMDRDEYVVDSRPYGAVAGQQPVSAPEKVVGYAYYGTEQLPNLQLKQRPLIAQVLPRSESQPGLSFPGGEDYQTIVDNPFKDPLEEGYSTFSIDVDTASYANVRRHLNSGTLPPKDAVRIEELVNYFDYDYPDPDGGAPFSAHIEVAECPWNSEHRLARIGLKGKEVAAEDRGPANLVFLIDVSGSMQPENKLPLLKKGLKLLVDRLEPKDRVAIVTYAGSSGLALSSTSLEKRETILAALESFEAGGSTNGGDGIRLAYKTAREHFEKEGINRVILATDGDFNVGVTDRNELIELIEKEAKSGVFLSVLGFGMGNLKDGNLEGLANKGNGHYAYIDTLQEARKVLVEQAGSTLVTIAKDVKIQVEFNPAKVGAFRLIGYENRVMPAEHFNDDTKDAGEIGAGHRVTALYEIVPRGKEHLLGGVDPLRYRTQETPSPETETALSAAAASDELLNLKLRYKPPKEDKSILLEFPVKDTGKAFAEASTDLRFAASVASFGMLLRDSEYKGSSTYDSAIEMARGARGEDPHGWRSGFLQLVELAKTIAGE